MCVVESIPGTRALLEDIGHRKTFKAWKTVLPNGEASLAKYRYKPGTHALERRRTAYEPYRHGDAAIGFHVYRHKQAAVEWAGQFSEDGDRVIEVRCRTADILAADSPGPEQEIALNAIHITKRAWEEAGLLKQPTRDAGR